MLMVLPTQFNVNPPLFFSLLGRSFPSPFPYTAAGGTGSRSTPPSGFGESTQDKKKKERERGTGGVFDGEGASGYRLKPDLAFEDIQLVLKGYNNNKNVAPSGEESSKPPLLIAFLF